MSKDTLSKEEIIHLAHNVIQTMQCEWEECTITLNSWDSLAKCYLEFRAIYTSQCCHSFLTCFGLQHLRRHCSRVKQQGGIYHCSYSRCSGRLHSSLAALKTHMELSHLSRVALPCPARGCKEVFIRVQQLPSHFEHVHRELLDIRVSVNAFAPLARLARPRHLQRLPPLPRHEIRVSSFLPSVSMPPVRREPSQASASQTLSRKWSRLNVQDQEGESDENPIAFGNLPLQLQDILAPQVVVTEVRKKLPFHRQPLLSRPQPAIHPIRSNEPEQSILYSTFKPMVDRLLADGTLAEHKEGGM